MREIIYGERETAVGKLRYDLLERETDAGIAVYGVEVTGNAGTASIPSVTANQKTALELAELLLRGGVLPTELPYIVEDWLERI